MVNSYKKVRTFRCVNLERFYAISRSIRENLDRHSEDINASTVAKFTGLDRKTINKIFLEIRQIIAKQPWAACYAITLCNRFK